MSYDFSKTTILVVEDNLPILELAKSILQTFGVGRVLQAKNGKEGLELCCHKNPDIVLIDWMMRPMDGIALTRRIRSDNRIPNRFVPIILMTGFSEKKRVIEARDAGVTEFLVKPFNARDLYRRIAQVIERPRQFIRSEDFFGPDRRRRNFPDFIGPFQRNEDPQDLKDKSQVQEQEWEIEF